MDSEYVWVPLEKFEIGQTVRLKDSPRDPTTVLRHHRDSEFLMSNGHFGCDPAGWELRVPRGMIDTDVRARCEERAEALVRRMK